MTLDLAHINLWTHIYVSEISSYYRKVTKLKLDTSKFGNNFGNRYATLAFLNCISAALIILFSINLTFDTYLWKWFWNASKSDNQSGLGSDQLRIGFIFRLWYIRRLFGLDKMRFGSGIIQIKIGWNSY